MDDGACDLEEASAGACLEAFVSSFRSISVSVTLTESSCQKCLPYMENLVSAVLESSTFVLAVLNRLMNH